MRLTSVLIALSSVIGMSLPVRTLDGEAKSFPSDAAAPRSVFVVTFTKAASKAATEWTRRLRVLQPPLPAAVFQVTVLEDVPKMFRGSVISGIARQVPASVHGQFWTAVADGDGWRQCTESNAPKGPSVFILDGRERIVWRAHGDASDAKIEEIVKLPAP